MSNTRVYASGLVVNNDKYLIIQRSNSSKYAPSQWEFVNGFISEDETVEECLLRELWEETGLKGVITKKLSTYETSDEDGAWIIIPFKVETTNTTVVLSNDHQSYKWVTMNELKDVQDISEDVNLMGLE